MRPARWPSRRDPITVKERSRTDMWCPLFLGNSIPRRPSTCPRCIRAAPQKAPGRSRRPVRHSTRYRFGRKESSARSLRRRSPSLFPPTRRHDGFFGDRAVADAGRHGPVGTGAESEGLYAQAWTGRGCSLGRVTSCLLHDSPVKSRSPPQVTHAPMTVAMWNRGRRSSSGRKYFSKDFQTLPEQSLPVPCEHWPMNLRSTRPSSLMQRSPPTTVAKQPVAFSSWDAHSTLPRLWRVSIMTEDRVSAIIALRKTNPTS